MKKCLLLLAVLAVMASCKKKTTEPEATDPHVANAPCGNCHATQQSQWASAADLHAASAADVLTNADHNTAELLNDNCLKCHSSFQVPQGIAHFVTPVDQTGSPAGIWNALNTADWKATKCEVCHNPAATNKDKLAKYGSILDGPWSAGYTSVTALPAAYQKVINLSTGDTSTYVYPDQTILSVQATKLCCSCHDPADQGSDPEVIVNGINLGPQGGDSRSYVATNHKGFGCIDCHDSHTFLPIDPVTKAPCNTCHPVTEVGKVHINHWN
jgi:hypothetical protein